MFIWQYIDLDPAVVSSIQQRYIDALVQDKKQFFQHLDIGISEFLDLPISRPVLIRVPPNTRSAIHTDERPKDAVLAINIPLINCDQSLTEFWKTDNDSAFIRKLTPNFVPFYEIDPNKCQKISEFVLTKPIIFDTSIPHSVHNYSNQIRFGISIRFKKDPWHLINI
jgi:hypothetical protein